MKISEVIKELQKQIEKHGDLDVVVRDDDYSFEDGCSEESYSYIDLSSFEKQELYSDNDRVYTTEKDYWGEKEIKGVLTIQATQ